MEKNRVRRFNLISSGETQLPALCFIIIIIITIIINNNPCNIMKLICVQCLKCHIYPIIHVLYKDDYYGILLLLLLLLAVVVIVLQ